MNNIKKSADTYIYFFLSFEPFKSILSGCVRDVQGQNLIAHLNVDLESVESRGGVVHGDLVRHVGQHHGGLACSRLKIILV